MRIQRVGFFMPIKIISIALFSLGFVVPAWASPRDLPVTPALEMETPPTHEPLQKPVVPPVPPRGQLLYENHCMICHESAVHIRSGRRIQSLPALRARVLHWAEYLQLRWGKEEVEDVVGHLNTQYYKFKSR